MIEFKRGDLFTEDAEALVNTVNCVGVMGRGVALQFKQRFPENFKSYAAACKRGDVQPGRMYMFETGELGNPRFIVNFPTKRHWRGKSRMSDITLGLTALRSVIQEHGIRSIAVPPLGSGLGGLNWTDVRKHIIGALENLEETRVVVFEPGGASDDARANKSREVPSMTAGRAALVLLMERYLRGLLDPFVTLLEVHKLMYFLQEAGEPLRLRYAKGPYGPYADNLRHVLREVEGHFISGYADGGEAPAKQLELVPGALPDATAFLSSQPEVHERLRRVSSLVEGFETPFGLELLATIHWVATRESAVDLKDIERKTYAWNPSKRQFTPRQIALAAGRLTRKGWINSACAQD